METEIFSVKGMHCASCAITIRKELEKISGVSKAEINFGTETAKISFAKDVDENILSSAISKLGYTLARKNIEATSKNTPDSELSELKHHALTLLPLALISIFVMSWEIFADYNFVIAMSKFWEEFFHHILPLFATYALFSGRAQYIKGAYRFFRFGKANMDSLIGIGTATAYIFSVIVSSLEGIKEKISLYINPENTYFDITIVVIAFVTLGKYLEARAKHKTGESIRALIALQPKTSIILKNGAEIEIPIENLKVGDTIVIKPGMKIPVDGVVLEGESFVDESMLTGEPMPERKLSGSKISAGTLNLDGTFTFRAEKIGKNTVLSHIIKMVENAQSSKAKIQGLADRVSEIFTPVALSIAVFSFLTWLTVGTFFLGFGSAFSLGLISFVSVLIIACPCALGLATPVALIVGIGNSARRGILIKDAEALENLSHAKVVMIDKTGTITEGKPSVAKLINKSNLEINKVIEIIASLEKNSEHPIAKAILNYAEANKILPNATTNFVNSRGFGIEAEIEGVKYLAGNAKFMRNKEVAINHDEIKETAQLGMTPVFLADNYGLIAIFGISDKVKQDSRDAVEKLNSMGINIIMLSGDDTRAAKNVADLVGIKTVFAEMSPEDKMNKIKEYQDKGFNVAFVGDGVNDAPALAKADIGIAMATGSDAAIETSGITLLKGDISKLETAFTLSKMTMRTIKQNLFWAFAYNSIGIPIAAGILYPFFGITLSPVFAGAAMALSSVSVIINALRIKIIN